MFEKLAGSISGHPRLSSVIGKEAQLLDEIDKLEARVRELEAELTFQKAYCDTARAQWDDYEKRIAELEADKARCGCCNPSCPNYREDHNCK